MLRFTRSLPVWVGENEHAGAAPGVKGRVADRDGGADRVGGGLWRDERRGLGRRAEQIRAADGVGLLLLPLLRLLAPRPREGLHGRGRDVSGQPPRATQEKGMAVAGRGWAPPASRLPITFGIINAVFLGARADDRGQGGKGR